MVFCLSETGRVDLSGYLCSESCFLNVHFWFAKRLHLLNKNPIIEKFNKGLLRRDFVWVGDFVADGFCCRVIL